MFLHASCSSCYVECMGHTDHIAGGGYSKGKQNNPQHRGKPIWAAALWKDTTVQVENMVVKECHLDAHVSKNCATDEHQNKQQMDRLSRTEVA